MTRLLALAALVVTALPARADDAPAGTPVAGGGVVSPDRKLVFLPAKGGGVEAVDLATGQQVWANKEASKLAGASKKLVFAWAGEPKKGNAFRVVALDAATGKTVGKSDPISMPEWASSAPTYGRSFRTAARAAGKGDEALVAWEARAFYAGGAAPSAEILRNAMKDASGLARVDLATGKVVPSDGKPKADDFGAGPGAKVGDYEFRAQEKFPGFRPGAPRVTTVTLTVLKGGKELWTRELAGRPYMPPLP
jgi:hypothetical protein